MWLFMKQWTWEDLSFCFENICYASLDLREVFKDFHGLPRTYFTSNKLAAQPDTQLRSLKLSVSGRSHGLVWNQWFVWRANQWPTVGKHYYLIPASYSAQFIGTLKGFFELTGFRSRALNLKDPVWCSTLGAEVPGPYQDQLDLVNLNFVFVKNRLVIFIDPDIGRAWAPLPSPCPTPC